MLLSVSGIYSNMITALETVENIKYNLVKMRLASRGEEKEKWNRYTYKRERSIVTYYVLLVEN